ncbi:alpha/beta fold hydrolase [Rhodococcus sp. PvR099]|jgi:pimeloyl-ACP methyl ester carboxylesterase|uniref:alpha/beta fold hydrolase n=1 Tax=Rhodococcus sp. PvR099 TaxID=2806602 RepID=UPI001AEA25A4|nr:alpha/beta fold hydrolase [Rhodococcus sp. PvR099]MBP1160691.1 proline iminopeptidase [Rhodococcus sp. PvR099]
MASRSPESLGRRITSLIVVTVALVLTALAGAAVFFASAALFDSVPMLTLCAIITVIVCSYGAGRLWARMARKPVPALNLLACATIFGLVCAATGYALVGRAAHQDDRAVVSASSYWDLPTGSNIAYRHLPAAGSATRSMPVIFLHGGPGTAGDGLPPSSAELAAAGYDVYSYDQVGSGRSSRLSQVEDYTVDRQVRDLEAIREVIAADRIVVMGQSWGGILAARYAAAHPDRVAGIVVSSPGALWAPEYPDGSDGNIRAHETPAMTAQLEETGSSPRVFTASVLQAINPVAAHSFWTDNEADEMFRRQLEILAPLAQAPDRRADLVPASPPGYWVNQMTGADLASVDDPRPALRNLRVPVLVMRGQYDYKSWPVTREYRDTFPNSTMVLIPDAGHAIAADRPELYTATVVAFLTDGRPALPRYEEAEPPPGFANASR